MAIASGQLRLLISAAKSGQQAAYKSLLDEYSGRLYGFFLRTTRNHSDAADLFGELSVKLVRSIANYDERGRFDSWLFTMAANLVRDRIRRLKNAPTTVSLDSAPAGDDERGGYLEPVSRVEAPDAKLLADERSELLHEALDQIDSETREMIMMRHFAQLSFAEIARRSNCPLGTVLARVHRGLAKLREKLAAKLAADSDVA